MEKDHRGAYFQAIEDDRRLRNRLRTRFVFLVVSLCLCISFWLKNTGQTAHVGLADQHSSNCKGGIKWTACGDNIECGRLEVPLDYANASLGTASLAVARYLATNKTSRLGSIMTNPGGPGGSGVNYIYRAGQRLSELVDGRYDIVSWDPRGINGTTPRVECFQSQSAQDVFFANTHQEILPDARNLSDPIELAVFTSQLRLADSRNAVWAQLCHEKSGETLRHVGTATVVRDLERLYSVIEGKDKPINFWGFSYGTVVGSYLVNMFPDRVGKVIIDGVVDPDLWANTNAHKWLKLDFVDAEKDLGNFYSACAEAGPDRCALASNSSTASTIASQVDKLLDNLYDRPMPVAHANRPGALTASMVKVLMFSHLYRPRDWTQLAFILSSALNGDGVPAMNNQLEKIELNETVPAQTAAAITAVTCVDTPSFEAIDKDAAFEDLLKELVIAHENVSPHFASLEVDMCHHWSARETERFTGPFNNTLSNAILVIGNTADPITPVQNARAVNRLLPNSSRLIVQDGSGHCSSAMGSLCTAKAIKNYFLEGSLPPNGLLCSTDEKLFPPKPSDVSDSTYWLETKPDALSDEDVRLLETIRALGESMVPYLSTFKRIRGF